MSPSSPSGVPDVATDVPRWARVCDRVTVAAFFVLASILTFGPLRMSVAGERISLSSAGRALLMLVIIAGVRHWRVPSPHLGVRLWRGLRAAVSDPAWRVGTTAFAGVRLPVLLAGFLAVSILGFPQPSMKIPVFRASESELLNLPVRWDAGWYLGVALDGYQFDPANRGQQNIAFFPGYPALMRAGGALLGSRSRDGRFGPDVQTYTDIVVRHRERTVLAGWLIALAAGFWGMVKLYRFAMACGASAERAGAVVMLASAYPFAYFYGALYTEPIFLVASVATFAAFVRRDYVTAACWGVLVGLVRPNGCFVSIPLALIATQQAFLPSTLRRGDGTPMPDGWRTWVPAMLTAAVPGLAMLAFTAWLYTFTGVGFAWMQAHKAWGREYQGLSLLTRHLHIVQAEGLLAYIVGRPIDFVNAVAVFFTIAMAIPVARTLGVAYGVFLVINAVPPLLAGGFLSLGRVTSTLFPMFLCLGLVLRPVALPWVLMAWAVGQGLLGALFFSWRPIF